MIQYTKIDKCDMPHQNGKNNHLDAGKAFDKIQHPFMKKKKHSTK